MGFGLWFRLLSLSGSRLARRRPRLFSLGCSPSPDWGHGALAGPARRGAVRICVCAAHDLYVWILRVSLGYCPRLGMGLNGWDGQLVPHPHPRQGRAPTLAPEDEVQVHARS